MNLLMIKRNIDRTGHIPLSTKLFFTLGLITEMWKFQIMVWEYKRIWEGWKRKYRYENITTDLGGSIAQILKGVKNKSKGCEC